MLQDRAIHYVLPTMKNTDMKKKTRFLPSSAPKFVLSQSFSCVISVHMGEENQKSFSKYKKLRREIKRYSCLDS